MSKCYRLINGPMADQWIVPLHIPFEVMEMPMARILYDPEPSEIHVPRKGSYSRRPFLINALQWDGWQ